MLYPKVQMGHHHFLNLIPRPLKNWAATGPRGERIATRYLRRKGYRVLGRNVRLRAGELDIVAEAPDQRTLVIVEVKSAAVAKRHNQRNELEPEAHVGVAKKRKLVALASHLVRKYQLDHRPVRFDVVGVDLPKYSRPVVRHHVAAFESTF